MERLMAILRSVNEDADWENEDALMDGGVLDSFDVIALVAALDDEYGLEIGAEELLPENFNSAAAIFAMVQRLSEGR
jgi:acyl carrier protein